MLGRFLRLAPLFVGLVASCGGLTSSSGSTNGGGAGGAAAAGGTGGGGGSGGLVCPVGSVTFHLKTSSGNGAAYCVGRMCTSEWLTITDPTERTFPLERVVPISPGCMGSCDQCRLVGCPLICLAPKPMKPDGETLTWDGTYYRPTMCGAQIPCYERSCAPWGPYRVTMCATPGANDSGPPLQCGPTTAPEICRTRDFEFPSRGVVELIVP